LYTVQLDFLIKRILSNETEVGIDCFCTWNRLWSPGNHQRWWETNT